MIMQLISSLKMILYKINCQQRNFYSKVLYFRKKMVPAINRLKIIVDEYSKTVFIEEALHRLVEIHYHLGLEEEAKKYASILGYNYNSSKWFEQSYKVFNKDYNFIKKKQAKEKKNIFKRIIDKIK